MSGAAYPLWNQEIIHIGGHERKGSMEMRSLCNLQQIDLWSDVCSSLFFRPGLCQFRLFCFDLAALLQGKTHVHVRLKGFAEAGLTDPAPYRD